MEATALTIKGAIRTPQWRRIASPDNRAEPVEPYAAAAAKPVDRRLLADPYDRDTAGATAHLIWACAFRLGAVVAGTRDNPQDRPHHGQGHRPRGVHRNSSMRCRPGPRRPAGGGVPADTVGSTEGNEGALSAQISRLCARGTAGPGARGKGGLIWRLVDENRQRTSSV
jgi:hypothetical protein